MKRIMHFAFLVLWPVLTHCGKDSSGSGVSSISAVSGVWTLRTLTIDNSTIDFSGDFKIELKPDGTFVTSESYRSIPLADYGPCWSTTRGIFETVGDKITTTDTEETAWTGCETLEEDKKFTSTYKLENSTLTLRRDGQETEYEKDTAVSSLEYASQKAIVESKSKVAVNTSADAYIEDANENDNWTLLATECDLSPYSQEITQYYRSELLGSSRVIKADYSLPALENWSNNSYTEEETSNGCGAPGLRSLKVSDLQQARASNNFDMLYACGATCLYTLVSETHDSNGNYLTADVTWECSNVGSNTLASPGIFGLVLDKHVGKASCQ